MASFKMISSSNSRNSDLSRRNSSSASSSPSIRSNHLRNSDHHSSRLSFGYEGTIQDYNTSSLDITAAIDDIDRRSNGDRNSVNGGRRKSVDDVWREIVSGKRKMIVKEEPHEENIMTLEDFLAKASAMEDDGEVDVKIPREILNDTCDYQMSESTFSGGMRGKRGRVMVEAMDKVAAQRQRRMIKNRESAARSRERKHAYQVELETLAAKLEKENEMLLKEIEDESKERYKKLMEQLIPVHEKPKASSSSRSLSRSHSSEW